MENYKNKEWLEKAFKEIGIKTEIAKKCNVSSDTIEYWRKKFAIPNTDKGKKSRRKNKINENFFDVIDTEAKAYWLGFIMADGCIVKTEKRGPYNRFELNLKLEDKSHLEKIQKDLESNYTIKEIQKVNRKRNFDSIVCNLRINSRKLVDGLISNEITPNKTGREVIPKTIPNNLIKHFIRGYFDGDGSITINKSFRICSSSLIILNSINEYLKKELNVEFKIYSDENYKVPFFLIDSNDKVKNKKVLDFLYNNASIFLDRKYLRYKNMYCSPMQ